MMDDAWLGTTLPQVIELTREAGRRILEIYSTDFDVDHKEDDSPLTAADMASHEAIDAGLKDIGGHLPILSEESAAISFAERSAWETYWLVDPLDGTREFVKRNGEFTVNIALIQAGKPVLGVVYAPVLQLAYYACRGQGAWKQEGEGNPQQIQVRGLTSGKVKVVGSRSHAGKSLEGYLEQLGAHELVPMGSSLKFCLVAEGSADLYPRFGPTSEWDTAAAQCVVEQAGGQVTDVEMQPLRYNTKESLLNAYFLVFGDPAGDWSRFL